MLKQNFSIDVVKHSNEPPQYNIHYIYRIVPTFRGAKSLHFRGLTSNHEILHVKIVSAEFLKVQILKKFVPQIFAAERYRLLENTHCSHTHTSLTLLPSPPTPGSARSPTPQLHRPSPLYPCPLRPPPVYRPVVHY